MKNLFIFKNEGSDLCLPSLPQETFNYGKLSHSREPTRQNPPYIFFMGMVLCDTQFFGSQLSVLASPKWPRDFTPAYGLHQKFL